MKNTLLSVIAVLIIGNTFAQAPAIEWQRTIGSVGYDFLNTISQTSDGGYILGGYSDGAISGYKSEDNIGGDDYWIVKLNASGNVEWENTVGGGNYDRLYAVEATADGGLIIGGQSLSGGGVGDKSQSNKGGYDYWIVKLDVDGIVEWDKSYGGTGNDQLYNVQPTSDGGYILAGSSDSGISGDKTEARVGNTDYWIIKIDDIGNIVWQNDIGGVMFETAFDAYETLDGGFIIGGVSNSGISGDKTQANFGNNDYWVVKLDVNGIVVWDKTFGGTASDYLYSLIPTADGGSIACGMSDSGVNGNKTDNTNGLNDYWVVKIDNSGNITWQNSIGGSGNEFTFVNAIAQTSDGGYAIAGFSQSTISGDKTEAGMGSWDYWLLKITSAGAIIWQDVIGGSSGDYANAIAITADEGFIVGGYSYSNAGGDKVEDAFGDADYWVMKLEGTGCVPFTEICNGVDDDCDALVDEDIVETIAITASGATTFCQGNSVMLSATHTGTSLQWKKNGANIPGATGPSYVAIKPGNYSCVTTSDCNFATSNVINVQVFKNPIASIIADGSTTFCDGDSVNLMVTPVGGCTYQWFKGAMPIAGATSLTYTATISGIYKCRVTKAATGCSKISFPIAVTVDCKEAGKSDYNFLIYPNPTSNSITINLNAIQNSLYQSVTIYNTLGEKMEQLKMDNTGNGYTVTANVINYPPGIYFVQVDQNVLLDAALFIKE